MANGLKVKRGTKAHIPTLEAGEFGFATDTYELFIGDGASNHQLAMVDSPALTGTPTAPTAAGGSNTTQIATTAFVRGEINAITPASIGAAASGHNHDSAYLGISATAADSTKWAGANKTISTSEPSGGSDGDIWFKRES